MFRSTVVGAALLLICLPVFADATREGIEASNAAFAAATARSDAAAVTALYTDDALLMPAGAANIAGRDAILDYWRGALSQGVGSVKLNTREVFGRGVTATEVGEYVISDKAGKPLDHGKYIVIWRRVNGKWKLHRDMFSTSEPASGR